MSSFAGSFLVAVPGLSDPNFRRTVVLLVQHSAEGAFGLVVNWPAEVEGVEFPVFTGGPCPSPGLLMLHGQAEWVEDDADKTEVVPGIWLGDDSCMTHVTEALPGAVMRYRLFAGYSGWGPGQLESELGGGGWRVVPATAQLLFDTPPEELWEQLAPPHIPHPSLN